MAKPISYFQGRKLVVATQHHKESVIGPPLQAAFGLDYFSSFGLDTDILGTFSGENQRIHSPLDAARIKCNMAMDLHQVDLAVSSEGSFGPHPHVFFLPADEEYMMLVDRKNNIEIAVKTVSTDTNYGSVTLSSTENLNDFFSQVKFPSHGLIIKQNAQDNARIEKGIVCEKTLRDRVDYFLKIYGQCYLETDMRALFNPTRMRVIQELVSKLVVEMNQICPKCHFPGFSVSELIRGLLCVECHLPTNSVKELVRCCKKCHYRLIENNPEKMWEQAMYCDFCNP